MEGEISIEPQATSALEPRSTWDPRALVLYFVLAYGFSTMLWLPALVRSHPNPFWFSLGMFGPTLSAFVTERLTADSWRAVKLWTSLSQLIFGLACGGSAVLLADFIAAFFMTRSGFGRWQWPALIQVFTLFVPNLLGGPLGEEAGWRGFALTRLQRRFDPVTSSLIVGFFWANWHLPLIFAHVYNVTWWQFVLLTCAASVLISFAFNSSGGSTICAILVHGLYNVCTGIILNDLIGNASLRSNEAQHNILWMVYGTVALLLCVITKGRLGYHRAVSS